MPVLGPQPFQNFQGPLIVLRNPQGVASVYFAIIGSKFPGVKQVKYFENRSTCMYLVEQDYHHVPSYQET